MKHSFARPTSSARKAKQNTYQLGDLQTFRMLDSLMVSSVRTPNCVKSHGWTNLTRGLSHRQPRRPTPEAQANSDVEQNRDWRFEIEPVQ